MHLPSTSAPGTSQNLLKTRGKRRDVINLSTKTTERAQLALDDRVVGPKPINVEGVDRNLCMQMFDILKNENRDLYRLYFSNSDTLCIRERTIEIGAYTLYIKLTDEIKNGDWRTDYIHIKLTETGKDSVLFLSLMTEGTGSFTRVTRMYDGGFSEGKSDIDFVLSLVKTLKP